MPPPLPATLSTNIRPGLQGSAIVPAFTPGNYQSPASVAGIPLASDASGQLSYGYVYQYATIQPCPDVIDMTIGQAGNYVQVDGFLSDNGVAGLIVLDRATGVPLLADLSLTPGKNHRFGFDRPGGRYRAIVLGGNAPLEDYTSSQNPFACTPEVIDMTAVIFGDTYDLHVDLTGPSGCLVYIMDLQTRRLAYFEYRPTLLATHDFDVQLANGAYRAFVFAVATPIQDA